MSEPLWRPSPERIEASQMLAFLRLAQARADRSFADYDQLWAWSVEDLDAFWRAVWDFCGILAERQGARAALDPDRMPGARFFPDARLNFARNLLRRRGADDAIVFWGEEKVRRRLTWDELHDAVSRLQQALRAAGIGQGDRVAGFVANLPEAVIAMLATASIGATWSSCSPDFGVQGVVDRFGQIGPRLLFFTAGYFYNGKLIDTLPRLPEILRLVPEIERAVIIPYAREGTDLGPIERATSWEEFQRPFTPRP